LERKNVAFIKSNDIIETMKSVLLFILVILVVIGVFIFSDEITSKFGIRTDNSSGSGHSEETAEDDATNAKILANIIKNRVDFKTETSKTIAEIEALKETVDAGFAAAAESDNNTYNMLKTELEKFSVAEKLLVNMEKNLNDSVVKLYAGGVVLLMLVALILMISAAGTKKRLTEIEEKLRNVKTDDNPKTEADRQKAQPWKVNPVLETVNSKYSAAKKAVAETSGLFSAESATARPSKKMKDTVTEAADTFKTLSKINHPLDKKDVFVTALAEEFSKNYSDAASLFAKAFEADEKFAAAAYHEGFCLFSEKDFEKAYAAYEKALGSDPGFFEAASAMGAAALRMNNNKLAESAYRKAAEINGEDSAVLNTLANILFVEGKNKDAEEFFKKAIELKPDSYEAYHNLGLVYTTGKEFAKAAEAYANAVELKPDKHDSLYNLACSYAVLGENEKALENLKSAVSIKRDYAKKARADKDFEHLLENPDFNDITS
jgi:Flp pilus assembly protein TadD/uncharacterized protein YxeA